MVDKFFAVLYLKVVIAKCLSFLSDDVYCKSVFFLKNFRFLRLDEVKTFSEKLYLLKLRSDMESLSVYADKLAVRDVVQEKIGKEVLVPIVGVYSSSREFFLDSMPDRFVLKLNSASGFNLVVTDKNKVNEAKVRKLIDRWLKVDFYSITRERQYKPIENKIVVEKFLEFEDASGLLDYKVYCFNGVPEMIQVISERSGFSQSHTYYDLDWNQLEICRPGYPSGISIEKPVKLEELLKYASILAEGFAFSRIDFYIVKDKIIFGEITFIPANGNVKFLPVEKDRELANKITCTY